MTLAAYFASIGTTSSAAATAVGVDQLLFTRVDQKRQPLPIIVANELAVAFGVQVGEVIAAAGLWTPNTDPLASVPLPPDPIFGDVIPALPYVPTVPVVLPSPLLAPPPGVWAVGNGLGTSTAGMRKLNLTTGATLAQVNFDASVSDPHEMAFDPTVNRIWTVGDVAVGGSYYFGRAQDGDDPALNLEWTAAGFSAPKYVAIDTANGALWVTNQTGFLLVRLELVAGVQQAAITITDGINNFTPHAVVVGGGFVYVVGTRGGEGRVFKIDPATNAVVATSTGLNLGATAVSLAYDPDLLKLYVASGTTLYAMPTSTLVAVSLTGVGLAAPTLVAYKFGFIWVSDLVAAVPRLTKFSTAGASLLTRNFTGVVAPGHVDADTSTGVLWVAVPGAGQVHKLNAANLSFSILTIATGGQPDGLLVVGV